jgi:hypothetical protein
MKPCTVLLIIWAASLAAQTPTPLPVDGNYVQGACAGAERCISIAACFTPTTTDFAGEVKLTGGKPFAVSLPSRKVSPTNVMPTGAVNPCGPTSFRLLRDGETPAADALLLHVRTKREFVQDAIFLLRYVSSAHAVLLEPNPEG